MADLNWRLNMCIYIIRCMRSKNYIWMALAPLLLATSCEKADFGDYESSQSSGGNLTITISPFEKIDFEDGLGAKGLSAGISRSATSISEVCSRIDMGVYQDSAIVESVTQTSDDEDFGTVSLSLDPGNYHIVVVAHNGLVKCSVPKTFGDLYFSNNKVTDTFHYYGEIDVTEESQTLDVEVRRIVAMFRLRVTGDIPDDADSLNFYYTGGSTRIDPTTGYGTTNNKPNDYRLVETDVTDYEIYTIPHEDDDVLKIVVTAYDNDGKARIETTFEDVPVTVNQITQYSGDFFSSWNSSDDASSEETDDGDSDSESAAVQLTIGGITADGSWDGEKEYSY